jgi:hypothetical protein
MDDSALWPLIVHDMRVLIVQALMDLAPVCVFVLSNVCKDAHRLAQHVWCARYPYPGLCDEKTWTVFVRRHEIHFSLMTVDTLRRSEASAQYSLIHPFLKESQPMGARLAELGNFELCAWYENVAQFNPNLVTGSLWTGLGRGGHLALAQPYLHTRNNERYFALGLIQTDRLDVWIDFIADPGHSTLYSDLYAWFNVPPCRFLIQLFVCHSAYRILEYMLVPKHVDPDHCDLLSYAREPAMFAYLEKQGVVLDTYECLPIALSTNLTPMVDYLFHKRVAGSRYDIRNIGHWYGYLGPLLSVPDVGPKLQRITEVLTAQYSSNNTTFSNTWWLGAHVPLDFYLSVDSVTASASIDIPRRLMFFGLRDRYALFFQLHRTRWVEPAWHQFYMDWKYGPAQGDPFYISALGEPPSYSPPTEEEMDVHDAHLTMLDPGTPFSGTTRAPLRRERFLARWATLQDPERRAKVRVFMKRHYDFDLE